MYRDWPFFRSTVDLIEMALAKADAGIAAHYDRQLVPPEYRGLRSCAPPAVAVSDPRGPRDDGAGGLLDDNPVLRRSIDVRNPYVDPINLLQVELLRRIRNRSKDDPDRSKDDRSIDQSDREGRALLVTINGIAAGCGTRVVGAGRGAGCGVRGAACEVRRQSATCGVRVRRQSARIAISGSTRAARRAGRIAASVATTSRAVVAAATIIQSEGRSPISRPAMR